MGSRRRGRELALQILYAMEMNPSDPRPSASQLMEETKIDFDAADFAEDIVRGVAENRDLIDRKIGEKSKNWALSRMARVDLNILRIATYELLIREDIPKNVTINEAIEVAKKFGTEDSPAFINGILDEIAAGAPEKSPGHM
ncbi:MAG TPA: transcription antitermination factor NusB [Geobacteraceae bacterium]|nr:transcription antitermination factor NusB [Geobacteraceae bacterium]